MWRLSRKKPIKERFFSLWYGDFFGVEQMVGRNTEVEANTLDYGLRKTFHGTCIDVRNGGGSMKNNSMKIALGATFFSMVLVFQNCSNAKFTTDLDANALNAVTGNGTTGGDDPSCRPTSVSANQIVKVLFVVDSSGSNVGEGRSDSGTDPNKTWRSTSINNFISAYKNRTNFHFGMITFQESSATPRISSGGTGVFSNNSSVVAAGYNSFINNSDSGRTPYKAALSLAKSIIAEDLKKNSAQKAAYAVVMISDGKPTDYSSADQVIPDATSIRSLAPGQVSLNTVYYYASAFDESETKYLRNISSVGGGQFLIANSSQTLKIDDVIQVPGMSCQ